jgi:hypothetical protein
MRKNQSLRRASESEHRAGRLPSFCFTSHGRNVKVRCNDEAVLERIKPLLPPDWQALEASAIDSIYFLWIGEGKHGAEEHRLYHGNRLVRQRDDVDWLLIALESELQMEIAEHARDRIFLHAGVVGWKGKALLLPGRSMAGKSTLVEALVRAGATYCSDEYAVLDQAGQVHPYARPLSLRQPKGVGPPRRLTANDLGGETGSRPLPAALVVAARYREGACWAPRRLATSQAFGELLNNTVPAASYPERALSAVGDLALRVRTLKGWRGEAAETAQALLCEMDRMDSR